MLTDQMPAHAEKRKRGPKPPPHVRLDIGGWAKACSRCEEMLPISSYQAKAKGFLGAYSVCKQCDYAARAERARPDVEARAKARIALLNSPERTERRQALIRDRARDRRLLVRDAVLAAMSPDQMARYLSKSRSVALMEDGRRRVVDSIPDSWCANCDAIFKPKRKEYRTFCSVMCAHLHQGAKRRAAGLPKTITHAKDGNHRRRAKRFGCVYERFDPIDIFERDGWTCQACGIATPRSSRGLIRDDAPTLDHVVPLALRGPHTPSNVRCLCLPCNLKKGAQPPP